MMAVPNASPGTITLRPLLGALVIGLPALLALVPLVLLLRAMTRDAVNLPWVDEWAFAAEIVRAHDGALSGADLWAQHNEHRVPAAKLLLHGLAAATHWDLRAGIAVNAVVAIGMLMVTAWLLVRTVWPVAPMAVGLLVAIAAAALCSLTQWQNWTWGWAVTLLLAEAAGFVAAAALVRLATPGADPIVWSTAAMLAALAGAFSNGSGLLLLLLVPLALLVLWLVAGRPPFAMAGVCGLVSTAAVGVYALGWQPAIGQPPQAPVMGHVAQLSTYALTLLGSPVASRGLVLPWRWGGAAVAVLVASVAFVWVRAPGRRTAMLPWALLGAYAVGAAGLTAIGRSSAGAHSALLSRYATFAVPLWVAVGPAVTLAIASVRRPMLRRLLALATVPVVALAALHGTRSWRIGDIYMAERAAVLRKAAACMSDPGHAPDSCYRFVCWDAALARNAALAMQARGLGPWAQNGSWAK